MLVEHLTGWNARRSPRSPNHSSFASESLGNEDLVTEVGEPLAANHLSGCHLKEASVCRHLARDHGVGTGPGDDGRRGETDRLSGSARLTRVVAMVIRSTRRRSARSAAGQMSGWRSDIR